jgi:hypothetical protein
MIFQRFSQINKKRKRQKLHSKNFVLKHTILYVHCVDLLIWSAAKLDFPFYKFSVIYYDFLKVQLK